MRYKSKYVIVETGMFVAPIIFSDLQKHNEVAMQFCSNRNKVLGAGFCFVDEEGKYQCYGESVSLGVKSRGEEDSKFLNKYLGVTED